MAKKEVKENKQKKHFFKDMKAELKKVIWPTPKQTANNTIAVIAFTLVVALMVFVFDLVFDSIHKYGVTPLQEKVQTSYQASHNSTSENTTDGNTTNETSNEVSNEATENGVTNSVEQTNTNSEE